MPVLHPDRGPAPAARLEKALEILGQQRGGEAAYQGATVSELCRLAGVSRNAVYRYHPTILAALRNQQHRSLPGNQTGTSPVTPTTEYALLQDQLSKLAALVDHYYAAYREARALLERRDRELAQLHRRSDSAPAPLHR